MIQKVVIDSRNFLFKTQNTIISAAAVLSITYGISAVLGLVRARLLASYFGASDILGVFYTADKIPSFIYTILVVGTLSTIFIPVFTGLLKQDDLAAWRTASSMLTSTLGFFAFLGVLVFVFAEPITRLLSLNKFTDAQVALGADLMRYMLVSQIILVISSFITGVLQSFRYFLIPALAPVLYNVGMILGIVLLSSRYGIYGPAIGVLIGAILHLLIQLPMLKLVHFKYFLSFDLKDQGLRQIFRLMPPRILGVAVTQLSGIVNNSLAILISTSSVVIFKFASQLQSFPVLLFGSAIAQAALPTLSYESNNDDKALFKKTFLTSFHQTMFLVIPASVVLLILKLPVVRLVYGAPSFDWGATLQTSYALAFFSFSIFSQSGVYLLTRAFYALKDTVTPVKVSSVTVFISICLSVFFIKFMDFGVWAVALSFTLASMGDLILLFYLMHKKIGGFDLEQVFVPFLKICYSAALMGLSLYIPMKVLEIGVLDTTRTAQLILLTLIAGSLGVISYIFFTWLLNVEEIALLYKLLRKIRGSVIVTPQLSTEHIPTE